MDQNKDIVEAAPPGTPTLPAPPEFHNHAVCQNCPGYCCHRFWLSFTKDELKKSLKEGKFKDDRVSAAFVLKYFRRIPRRDKPELQDWYNRAYTCKKFDNKMGRCKSYKNRPKLCRLYACELVKDGGDPGKSIPAGMGDAAEWGKGVLARRARRRL